MARQYSDRTPQLEIRDLRRIVTLATEGSFTRAAEKLNISQSVLTRSIQDIERSVNFLLFDRERGGITATAAGQAVIDEAQELLHDFDRFSGFLGNAARGTTGRIQLGLAPAIASAVLPKICERISDQDDLDVLIAVRRPEELLRLLLDGRIEMMICPDGAIPDDAPTRIVRLGNAPLTLAVRPGHPLLRGQGQGVADPAFSVLTATPVPPNAYEGSYFSDYLRHAKQMVIEDHQCLSLVAENSDSIWVTSLPAVRKAIDEGRLVELPPPPGEARQIVRLSAHSLARHSVSPAMKMVMGYVQELMRSLDG